MRTLIPAALLALLASLASAQRIAAAPAHLAAPRQATTVSTSTVRSTTARDFARFGNHHHLNPLFSPFGIFSDFPDPDSSPENPARISDAHSVSPDLLLQTLAALTANQQLNATSQPAKSDSHSLLIELQGNNYVSLTSAQPPANSPEPTIVPLSLKRSPKKVTSEKPAATPELLPVTLLFRDGHTENVRDYIIANGVIYVRGDFYRDGYWNRRIELSALDLSETMNSNQARGIRFVLPNAPNEVVTRP